MDITKQQTLVLIKPDAMERNLSGEIIARIQRTGLKLIDAKMIKADSELAGKHYPVTDEWLTKVGNNSIDDCTKYGLDVKELMGSNDPKEVGKLIHKQNKEFLMSGKVLALIFEGPHAIEIVRKLVGSTIPVLSPAGTIRGDYCTDSAITAGLNKRSVYNMIHASGNADEALREIELWFPSK